ncbi:MAG: hypothetical protein LBG30_05840, partial [Odoribacteraceae bacterium]|nr:hypothetical protein [Odoribacteraceae bacterium]
MKHYEFVDQEPREFEGHLLRRIRCTRPVSGVIVGELGGWIEHEDNLRGEAWAGDESVIFGKAFLSDNASAWDHAIIRDRAQAAGWAAVYDNVVLRDDSRVFGHAVVAGKATMLHASWACDCAYIRSNAVLRNEASIQGVARIGQDAAIRQDKDYCVFSNLGRGGSHLTAYRARNEEVRLDSHLFVGPLYVFEDWIRDDHSEQETREYQAIIEVIKI